MDHSAADTQAARNLMVDGQVRPNKVTDRRIVDAMRALPRERFVPARLAPLAYSDDDVNLGNGRFLMEPMVIARLVQAAAARQGDRALVVAAGSGYGAALLAACGAQVTALEEDPALLGLARSVLPEMAPSAAIVSGPIVAGWPGGAPYDIVLIEGAVEEIPPAIAAQVKRDGGRLLTVRAMVGGLGLAVLAEPTQGGLSVQPLFDCATPVLPAMRRAPGFVF
ncbi:protein-L-isoaspartate O-methyltransferase family protein [Limobrevibacterium gyesilva]|uniref:Protein-L-isoaspartate O-methyltransferase n=1 Tax=Limobrevibacterium gyesilva TaxID=2991712 RepID=A0AA42CG79_9PROT|nr:protein-L-isoaspartate O-methyltransferase [Limobrevibacterium gyesilva]MCW3475756.1 protein-L-isoaspartate O-methyltransferase [Limobrevibacterium gyesilva]